MVQWVVFDYGRVISQDTAALSSLASMLGAPRAEFEAAYAAERNRYDRGCTDPHYWRAVGAHLGVEVDPTLAGKLTSTDTNGWLATAPETLALIDELARAGVPLAVLSNAPASFARVVEQQPWAQNFQHLIFSADLMLAKPEVEIWTILLNTLDVPAGECLFFDDKQDNIDAAREAGLHVELWRDAESARQTLRAHGLLPATA